MFCLVMSFSASSSFLRLMPMMGARMRMPFSPFFTRRPSWFHAYMTRNSRGCRALSRDLQDIPEGIRMKAAHRIQVGGECVGVSGL